MTDGRVRMNDRKIFNALNKLGFEKSRKRIDGKVQRGYYIKRIADMKVEVKQIAINKETEADLKRVADDYNDVPF